MYQGRRDAENAEKRLLCFNRQNKVLSWAGGGVPANRKKISPRALTGLPGSLTMCSMLAAPRGKSPAEARGEQVNKDGQWRMTNDLGTRT